MLRLLARFLKLLGSETDPGQIALAVTLAMVAGLTPLASPHNLLVLLLLLVLRANLSAFLLALAAFSGVAYLLDPLSHRLGLWLLTLPPLQGPWTYLYNVPGMRLTRFHHTLVLGSAVLALALVVPVYLLTAGAIRRYRERVLARVRGLKLVQALRASRIVRALRAAGEWGEGS